MEGKKTKDGWIYYNERKGEKIRRKVSCGNKERILKRNIKTYKMFKMFKRCHLG